MKRLLSWKAWALIAASAVVLLSLFLVRFAGDFRLELLAACSSDSSDEIHGAADTTLHVAWFPHPDPSVIGYNIYFGSTSDTATTLAANLPVNSPGFDSQAPSVEFNLLTDLGLKCGEAVCFRLRAYNSDGLSGWSPGICRTV